MNCLKLFTGTSSLKRGITYYQVRYAAFSVVVWESVLTLSSFDQYGGAYSTELGVNSS